MRFIGIILLFMTLLVAESIDQKLIFKAERNSTQIEKELALLKVYFNENSEAKRVQEKYHLQLGSENLGAYRAVVIKPVRSQLLKRKLQEMLQSKTSGLFFVNEREGEASLDETGRLQETRKVSGAVSKNWISVIGLQWIVLLLLAVTGLLLSLYNRRALAQLKREQEGLGRDQIEMEKQIKSLGESDV